MHRIQKIDGLTLIFSPISEINSASIGVFVNVGSRHEKKSQLGIAHFLEHLVFKGTKNYTYQQIQQEIEGRGGSLNGFTSHENTAYYARCLGKNVESTLDILLDMVIDPLFKRNDIKKERNVILEEIKMYNDLPSSRAVTLLDKMLWPNHPLGEDVIGLISTIKKMTKEDIADFKKKYYNPENMVVCCVGKIDEEKIIKYIKKRIRGTTKKKLTATVKAPSILKGTHIATEHKNLEQTRLCLGFRSPSYTSKFRYTTDLVNVILGANMSSRLFQIIREEQALCYDVSTDARKYRDSGGFIIHLGLDKTKITTALKSILQQLEIIREKLVPKKELSRAKDYLLGQLSMSLERSQGRMFFLADSFQRYGKVRSVDDVICAIESVTPKDIQTLAKQIFNFNSLAVSCIGNLDRDISTQINKTIGNFR